MKNKIKKILCEAGAIDETSIVHFYDKVRDRDDVSVLKCEKTGVIFLSQSDHIEFSHYGDKQGFDYWSSQDRNAASLAGYEDSCRRFEQFKNIIANKRWIDIGTGAGGVLDLLSPVAASTIAVEPQKNVRSSLIDLGYKVFPSISDVTGDDIEVATFFHVFEHLSDPIETLNILRKKMAQGGKVVIEVPHAKDFLISFLELEEFKSFTFWSEHLILHTRDSLRLFLEKAGFSNISVKGYQRYPLANHLHWLSKRKPGGHIAWDHLRMPTLDIAYSDMLSKMDHNDTLIAIATNGE